MTENRRTERFLLTCSDYSGRAGAKTAHNNGGRQTACTRLWSKLFKRLWINNSISGTVDLMKKVKLCVWRPRLYLIHQLEMTTCFNATSTYNTNITWTKGLYTAWHEPESLQLYITVFSSCYLFSQMTPSPSSILACVKDNCPSKLGLYDRKTGTRLQDVSTYLWESTRLGPARPGGLRTL